MSSASSSSSPLNTTSRSVAALPACAQTACGSQARLLVRKIFLRLAILTQYRCLSDSTKSQNQEITDAFGEFHTDIHDNYRGGNDINASYYMFFASSHRTDSCTQSIRLLNVRAGVPLDGKTGLGRTACLCSSRSAPPASSKP